MRKSNDQNWNIKSVQQFECDKHPCAAGVRKQKQWNSEGMQNDQLIFDNDRYNPASTAQLICK